MRQLKEPKTFDNLTTSGTDKNINYLVFSQYTEVFLNVKAD